ncbi:hypothetical protein LOC68_09830 [Blastopirellula sp. JC732]|uniref:Uncharacterized protein n=1 Tax=Blastopirellula sediminis TaxID=2894196 RepID=A0A9X1MLU0_9BACT|nr:hypothetical protein [Blastopirellula sediminis]MCC9608526.1 hypothetical protein [Blastopirellula sediminis]MCC9628697.1 hypothetical protein [Blastopirellula sediminis]
MSKQKQLRVKEAVGVAQHARQVDRESGVIRMVQICGPLSRNGRNYAAALDSAVGLYEGVKVNIDHGFAPGEERSFLAGFGVLRNVKRQGDALYGDLHFLKSHQLAELVCERAERFPETFGLSHDADIDGYVDDAGVFQVTKIIAVRSVDLVGEPATARGIFESERTGMKTTIGERIASLDATAYPARDAVLAKLQELEIDGEPILERPWEEGDQTPGEALATNFRTLVIAALDAQESADVIHAICKTLEQLQSGEAVDSPQAVEESRRNQILATLREVTRRLDFLERDQWAASVLESAGMPSDSPLRQQLRTLTTRAEMEAFVDASDLGPALAPIAGGEISIWESNAPDGESLHRTREQMYAAWGIGSK